MILDVQGYLRFCKVPFKKMVFETQSTRLDLQAALEGARQAGVGAPGGA